MLKRKRKRAVSEEPRLPPSVPLTHQNLTRLEAALSPAAMAPPRTMSPTRSTTSTTTLDSRKKLSCYRIHVETEADLPADLKTHITTVILRDRNPDVAPSPHAKNVVARRRIAAMQIETDGSKLIAPFLLPVGEADMDTRVDAVPLITQKAELLLNRYFLPPAPNKDVTKTWKDLSQPKPDSCIGYVLRDEAMAAGVRIPFTEAEEGVLNDYILTKALHAPFLTCQWKSPTGQEGLHAAQSQSARDGATIVNYLYDLYQVAYGKTPSVVDTCHFSIVCDIQYAEVWVHWRDGHSHHMEQLFSGHCRKEVPMLEIRGIVRNIQQYAINERLQSIRQALPAFARGKKTRRYPVLREPIVDDDSASQPALSHIGLGFPTPRVPSNVASEPVKKRQRTSDSGFHEEESI